MDREQEFRRASRERAQLEHNIRERSPLRLHAQIRTGIRSGAVAANERLDEDELVKKYSISRNSVRAALALLASEGIVSRSPRRGTVVIEQIEDIPIGNGVGWNMDDGGRHVSTSLGSSIVPTPPMIADLLATECATVRVNQLIDYRDGVPFMLHIRYLPGDAPRRVFTGEEPTESFEQLFETAYGSALARVDCSIQAVSSDERTARLLEVPAGSALLLKERLLWDATGQARELSHSYYIASRAALSTTTWMPGVEMQDASAPSASVTDLHPHVGAA
ncbi:GntR family transcriptional regulator [Frondihabitans cladoniiphilus]|uniref:HTH gntR-type domain-containing protein n=1 Tax=Frondihabitans cladoniiphilus TaxID=715785 RepID=A0ABP8VYP4_9MICO